MLGLGLGLTNFGTKGGVVDTPDLSGSSAAALLAAYGGEGFSMIFDGTAPSLKITDSTTPSNDWDSDLGDGYSVQDFFKSRSFTSYTGPVSSGKRLMQADGYIKPCRHNLNKMSNRAASAAWTKQNASVVAKTAISVPSVGSGTTTDALRASGSAGVKPAMYQALTVPANIPFTLSAYCYAGTTPYVALNLWATAVNYAIAVFNLSAGAGSATETFVGATSGTIYATAITDAGGGWYRISMTASTSQTTVYSFHQIAEAATGNTVVNGQLSWTAAGTEDAYFWGMQTNNGYLLDYVSSEAHNLCLQSQTFGTSWVPDASTISSDVATAPDGTTTADANIPNAGAGSNATHQAGIATISGGVTTLSCYVKLGGLAYSHLEVTTTGGSTKRSWFDLTTGATGTVQHTSSQITHVGNSWYRCSVTYAAGSTSETVYLSLRPANGSSSTVTGDGATVGLYLWGAQIELASSPGKYVATTTAAVYNQHFDLPVEYNTDGTVKALTREEARTNLALYSNALATSPWGANLSTVTNNAVASPSGRTDATSIDDLTSAGAHNLYQAVTLSSGTTYTLSVYLKDSNRQYVSVSLNRSASASTYFAARFDLTNVTAPSTSVGSTSGTISAYGIEDVGNGWRRAYITGVVGAITDGLIVISSATDGTTWTADARGLQSYTGSNKVFYAYGVQCEAASTKSSLVVSGSAAVTRAADVITTASTIFPTGADMSFYGKFKVYGDGTANLAPVFSMSNAGTTERIDYRARQPLVIVTSGGVDGLQMAPSSVSLNTTAKFALRSATNDAAISVSGAAVVADTSGTAPNGADCTILYLGRLDNATYGSDIDINEFMILPTGLVDASLVTLTTS